MSYEFDLQELEGPLQEADGSYVIEFILGFDAETDTIVVMSVILFPQTGQTRWNFALGSGLKRAQTYLVLVRQITAERAALGTYRRITRTMLWRLYVRPFRDWLRK